MDNKNFSTLAALLGFCYPPAEAAALAERLFRKFNTLANVVDAGVRELMSVKGMTDESVRLLKMQTSIAEACLEDKVRSSSDVVRCKDDLLKYLNLKLGRSRIEKLMAIYLNAKCGVLGMEVVTKGSVDHAVVYMRRVVDSALRHNARAIIFVHNHPSGDPSPSKADWNMAVTLRRVLGSVDITVYDYLIIGRGNHFSGRERGWLAGAENSAMPSYFVHEG
ncbi:MAG: hypothetical protein OEV59_05300 [Deltaproteobacteria bacterium]|nr:hypothetical protein [Deltaproteobacteria bacterium]